VSTYTEPYLHDAVGRAYSTNGTNEKYIHNFSRETWRDETNWERQV